MKRYGAHHLRRKTLVFQRITDDPTDITNQPGQQYYFGLAHPSNTEISECRLIKYHHQRKQQGFDDTEVWNLDITFAEFALPRLKRFKEVHNGVPAELCEGCTIEEGSKKWDGILDHIIKAFEWHIDRNARSDYNPDDWQADFVNRYIHEGLGLFAKYFFTLWY